MTTRNDKAVLPAQITKSDLLHRGFTLNQRLFESFSFPDPLRLLFGIDDFHLEGHPDVPNGWRIFSFVGGSTVTLGWPKSMEQVMTFYNLMKDMLPPEVKPENKTTGSYYTQFTPKHKWTQEVKISTSEFYAEQESRQSSTDFLVECTNPKVFDETVHTLGAMLHQDANGGYVKEEGYYRMRVLGDADFVRYAIEHQGYGKIIKEVDRGE